MAVNVTPTPGVLRQALRQGDLYREALTKQVPDEVVQFIEEFTDLDEVGDHAILETSSTVNLINLNPWNGYYDNGMGCIINLKRLNDIRYVNKFLESVNAKLRHDGLLFGCVETSELRKKRLLAKYTWPFNWFYYFFDFLVKRVWPKLPYLKKYYFMLTVGRNRVISEMETYGRLYSCGFKLEDTHYADGRLYFAARKQGVPAYNTDASYGPLIRLRRVGKNGKIFKVYKFRTMHPYSEYIQDFVYRKNGLQSGGKLKDDPRISTVGHIFRKFWIDELPMLYNLIRGDLKIFGVRPISQHYMSLYPKEFQEFRKKFKPGLIPPVYVEIPKTIDDVVEIERRYLQAYDRNPLGTDIRYLTRFIYNVVLKRVRSK
ncbi:MAG: sugar transferase [Lewinellaceae bacterium]|nr:sugar transferase [Lewinella sp.]MCB9280963.1 sugar transferase [Lewinellaceae bacterium]